MLMVSRTAMRNTKSMWPNSGAGLRMGSLTHTHTHSVLIMPIHNDYLIRLLFHQRSIREEEMTVQCVCVSVCVNVDACVCV